MVISSQIKSKLVGFEDNLFSWLEEKKSDKKNRIKLNHKTFYTGFQLNALTIREGDCVHINTAYNSNSSSNYDIARVLECYDEGQDGVKGIIKVLWYIQAKSVRKGHRKHAPTEYPPLNHVEVFRDLWSYGDSVDVETVASKCCIVEVAPEVDPSSVKRPEDAIGPLYVARFAYQRGHPCIIPLTKIVTMSNVESKNCGSPLSEITNSSNKQKRNSTRKSFMASSNSFDSSSTGENNSKHAESRHERKRKVKRKLIDLDENEENVLKKLRVEVVPLRELNKLPSSSEGSNNYFVKGAVPSPLRSKEAEKMLSPKLKKIKSLIETDCTTQPDEYKGTKLEVAHSPKLKKNKSLKEEAQSENKVTSNPQHKKVEETPNKSLTNSPGRNSKIETIKSIGQCRGLKLGEISDLLTDEVKIGRGKITPKSTTKAVTKSQTKTNSRVQKSAAFVFSDSDCSSNKSSSDESDSEKVSSNTDLPAKRVPKPTERLKNSSLKVGAAFGCDSSPSRNAKENTKLKISESPQTKSVKRSERDKDHDRLVDMKNTPKSKTSTRAETSSPARTPIKHSKGSTVNHSKSTPSKTSSDTVSRHSKGGPLKISKPSPIKHSRNTPSKHLETTQSVVEAEFEEAKAQLHVSAVPSFLPCREEQFQEIFSFIEGKLLDSTGGCMYVSGVPGTGKTATVREVVRLLQETQKEGALPPFQYLEVNAMKLTRPQQLWVQIWEGLSNERATAEHSYSLFVKFLSAGGPKRKSTLLLLDELDLLWTRKQDVMYNLFDLSSRIDSRLIVVTIANTMDLPERMMISRVSSRLGLTRMTFQPYTFKQLQEIIESRLRNLKVFDPDAIQLVARKVAAVSGDARRALDICRRATELVERNEVKSPSKSPSKIKPCVGMTHVSKAINEMFSLPKITAIRQCSQMGKYLLQAILSEFMRTGVEEASLNRVMEQFKSICLLEGLSPPSSSDTMKLLNALSSQRIVLTEHSRLDLLLRIRLNISTDDTSYALSL